MRHFLPFAKQFAKVRPGRHTRYPLVGSALAPGMQESTKFVSTAAGTVNRGSTRKGPPSKLSSYLPDGPTDQSREGLVVASGVGPGLAQSEHGPCLNGGTLTLGNVSFTTKNTIHSRGDAFAPSRFVALFDTGSPQISIRRDVLDRMRLVSAI